MPDGIDNLAVLFEPQEHHKPERMDDATYEREIHTFKQNLQFIIEALDKESPSQNPTDLSYALASHWPTVSLDRSRKELIKAGSGIVRGDLESPYASGHANAATLFLNPSRTEYDSTDAQRIWLRGMNWEFSKTPIKSTDKVLVSGRLVFDPVSALGLYLDRIEQGVEAQLVGVESINAEQAIITHKELFSIGPEVGLSLVGYGDALLKAAKIDAPQRERDYLELARRAYKTSGFSETLYVGNKLASIGEFSPRTHFLVPAQLLPAELRQQLMRGIVDPISPSTDQPQK